MPYLPVRVKKPLLGLWANVLIVSMSFFLPIILKGMGWSRTAALLLVCAPAIFFLLNSSKLSDKSAPPYGPSVSNYHDSLGFQLELWFRLSRP